MIPRSAVFALALPFASPVLAEGFLISPPLECDLEKDCYIQQYVDSDPSSDAMDFTCGALSYDGRKGTDFALPDRARINDNIPVLASAAGRVSGMRDGMADSGYSSATADDIDGKECGNGVVLDHGNGWETQYCHLKQGSISVKTGQEVALGETLGFVGQSGKAAFPHVHLSVRQDGAVIDPFDPDGTVTCDTPGDSSLWSLRPEYRGGGLISIGFSEAVPAYNAIKHGDAAAPSLSVEADALVIWGHMFGTRADDIINLSITGPDGMVISDDVTLTKTQAQAFRAIGKRGRVDWPAGTYTGTVTMIRGLQIISQRSTDIEIR